VEFRGEIVKWLDDFEFYSEPWTNKISAKVRDLLASSCDFLRNLDNYLYIGKVVDLVHNT
jgi:hypothetical protein